MIILQVVTILLVGADLWVHLWRELRHGHIREDALDAKVEAAQRAKFDVGFENIMAYSVRGRTGFEGED